LCEAAENGHCEVVKCLLTIPGVDVNLTNFEHDTPFVQAARSHNLPILKLLAGFSDVDSFQMNSAFVSAYHKSPRYPVEQANEFDDDLFQFFMSFPSLNVNSYLHGQTVLMLAAVSGNVSLVQELLRIPEIDPNVYDRLGNTALLHAVSSGSLELVKLLVEFPRTNFGHKTLKHDTAVSIAARSGSLEILKFLISCSRFAPGMNSAISRGLVLSIFNGQESIWQFLCTLDFDINKAIRIDFHQPAPPGIAPIRKVNPLTAAVDHRDVACVYRILGHSRFDAAKSDVSSALFSVIDSGDFQLFQLLLRILHNDVSGRNENNQSILTAICQNAQLEMLQFLLELPTFDLRREDLRAAVTAAVFSDFRAAIPILAVIPGVNLNDSLLGWQDGDSPTWHTQGVTMPPLVAALTSKQFLMFRELMRIGDVDLNVRTKDGRPLLFSLVDGSGPSEGMELLTDFIETGRVDVNATDLLGNTVLHWSVAAHKQGFAFHSVRQSARPTCWRLLLRHGVDRTLKNAAGMTPWELAFANGETLPEEPDDADEWTSRVFAGK
jgi:ankyrin repeat protein